MLHNRTKSSRKGFSPRGTIAQSFLDPWVVMCGKQVAQIPTNVFSATRKHASSSTVLLYKPSLLAASKCGCPAGCDFLDSACMMLEFVLDEIVRKEIDCV
jgi:hypothetical protein